MPRLALVFLFLYCCGGICRLQAQTPDPDSAARSGYGEKVRIAGIPNAGKISDGLYRGGQPHSGSLRYLKEIGITTIVDLRAADSAARDREKNEAESLGIQFVSIPLGGWSVPAGDQVAKFLALFAGNSQ